MSKVSKVLKLLGFNRSRHLQRGFIIDPFRFASYNRRKREGTNLRLREGGGYRLRES